MTSRHILWLIAVAAIALYGISDSFAQSDYHVGTDRTSYGPGDTVLVSGKVPLPTPQITATRDGTALYPNHYHVSVGSTLDVALPQELGLSHCAHYDFDMLAGNLYRNMKNSAGVQQEPGRYYHYGLADLDSDGSREMTRFECGFDRDGSFSFGIPVDSNDRPGEYKVGFQAYQRILIGNVSESMDWQESATFEIRESETPAPTAPSPPAPTAGHDIIRMLLNMIEDLQAEVAALKSTVDDLNRQIKDMQQDPTPAYSPVTITFAAITAPDTVTITFSEPLDAGPDNFTGFTLTNGTGIDVPQPRNIAGFNLAADTAYLTISGTPMPPDATATVNVSGLVDNAGFPLAPLAAHPVADGQA